MERPGPGPVGLPGSDGLLVCLRSDQKVPGRPEQTDEGPGGSAVGRAEPAGPAGQVSPIPDQSFSQTVSIRQQCFPHFKETNERRHSLISLQMNRKSNNIWPLTFAGVN